MSCIIPCISLIWNFCFNVLKLYPTMLSSIPAYWYMSFVVLPHLSIINLSRHQCFLPFKYCISLWFSITNTFVLCCENTSTHALNIYLSNLLWCISIIKIVNQLKEILVVAFTQNIPFSCYSSNWYHAKQFNTHFHQPISDHNLSHPVTMNNKFINNRVYHHNRTSTVLQRWIFHNPLLNNTTQPLPNLIYRNFSSISVSYATLNT